MRKRVNSETSILVYCICCFILSSLIYILRKQIQSTPISVVLGGFIGSLVFFFLVIIVGQIFELTGSKRKPGWIPITLSMILSNVGCFLVHKFCFLSCFCFCVPMGIYLIYSSNLIFPPQPKKEDKKEK